MMGIHHIKATLMLRPTITARDRYVFDKSIISPGKNCVYEIIDDIANPIFGITVESVEVQADDRILAVLNIPVHRTKFWWPDFYFDLFATIDLPSHSILVARPPATREYIIVHNERRHVYRITDQVIPDVTNVVKGISKYTQRAKHVYGVITLLEGNINLSLEYVYRFSRRNEDRAAASLIATYFALKHLVD